MLSRYPPVWITCRMAPASSCSGELDRVAVRSGIPGEQPT